MPGTAAWRSFASAAFLMLGRPRAHEKARTRRAFSVPAAVAAGAGLGLASRDVHRDFEAVTQVGRLGFLPLHGEVS